MANFLKYKDTQFKVGDTITVSYKIKEGDKERVQLFTGILLGVKGDSEVNRMITVRKISKIGIGVERIFPIMSPAVANIKLTKKGNYTKAKLFYIRELSESDIRRRLYRQ